MVYNNTRNDLIFTEETIFDMKGFHIEGQDDHKSVVAKVEPGKKKMIKILKWDNKVAF